MPDRPCKLPAADRVINWSQKKVELWLKKVGLEDCVEAFRRRQIDGSALVGLTDEKLLQWCGEVRIKHKMQIMKYVRDCKTQGFSIEKELRRKNARPTILPHTDHHRTDSGDDHGWDTDFDDDEDEDEVDRSVVTHRSDKKPNFNELDANCRVPIHDINHNSPIIQTEVFAGNDDTEETLKKSMPKPPNARPSVSNYPKFTPLKLHNNSTVKRPQTLPPPPPLKSPEVLDGSSNITIHFDQCLLQQQIPTNTEDEEDYEIPNSSNNSTSSSSCSLVITTVQDVLNFRPPPPDLSVSQDMYETLDSDAENSLLDVPDVPPEIVPCTRSPSSRLKSTESPSLPPRRGKDIPASSSPPPPPLPKKISPPPPTTYNLKLREIVQESKTNLINRPLPPTPPEERDNVLPSVTKNIEDTNNNVTEVTSTESVQVDEKLNGYDWYHRVERDEAIRSVEKVGVRGTYLVRESRRGGVMNPYTLTIYYNDRVFHLNIRKRSDNSYALGSEKINEPAFGSLPELINRHRTDPILLSVKGKVVGKTCLLQTPSSKT